jgi:VanZ family protein
MAASTVNRSIRNLSLWLPVILCMGLIFSASNLAGKEIPDLFPGQDILYHGMIYAILGLFFYRALKNTNTRLIRLQLMVCTVFFGLAYGASDELHQLLVPGRFCTAFDLVVDTIGSSAGSILGGFLHKWLK